MGREGDRVLVEICRLEGASIRAGHPVRRADEGRLGMDVVGALLLTVGAPRHADSVGAASTRGLETRTIGICGGGVGVGSQDGFKLGGGKERELLGQPPADVGFGADDRRDEKRAFVGVGSNKHLLAIHQPCSELLARKRRDVGVVGDGVERPTGY